MVEVHYIGRLGNNLFQYCFGRILAERLGYKLCAKPILHFPGTYARIEGASCSHPEEHLSDQMIDLNTVLDDKTDRKIVLSGFFQRFEYYKDYQEQIRNVWLNTGAEEEKVGRDDLVVCVRRTDYTVIGWDLPFSYYQEAIERMDFERLYICADDKKDPWLKHFEKYRPILSDRNAMDDFNFISSFDKIICANSTFHWWATFLSNASQIIMPIPARGCWSPCEIYPIVHIDLRIDLPNYQYLTCP